MKLKASQKMMQKSDKTLVGFLQKAHDYQLEEYLSSLPDIEHEFSPVSESNIIYAENIRKKKNRNITTNICRIAASLTLAFSIFCAPAAHIYGTEADVGIFVYIERPKSDGFNQFFLSGLGVEWPGCIQDIYTIDIPEGFVLYDSDVTIINDKMLSRSYVYRNISTDDEIIFNQVYAETYDKIIDNEHAELGLVRDKSKGGEYISYFCHEDEPDWGNRIYFSDGIDIVEIRTTMDKEFIMKLYDSLRKK